MMYAKWLKRIFDILFSGFALLILSPIMIILVFIIKHKLGSPVIFSQKRPGKDGNIFKMYKFRSMTNEKDPTGKLLPDDQRLTNFGKRLRSSSCDELPELWNVLKGEMSLVGPRPLLVQYLPLYNERQRRRHEVKPGITGYAQVNGRNSITWEEKFEMDVWYADHISLMTDLKIIVKTIKTVLIREGVHSDTSATMEPFKGSK